MSAIEPIKIFHGEGLRSIRVAWVCEELDIPYTLIFKRGDIAASLAMIQKASPLMPMCPVVDLGKGKIMVESGAIIEFLQLRYGKGRLAPDINSEDFHLHLQWLHFAEGVAMFRIWARMFATMVAQVPVDEVPEGYAADGKTPGMVGVRAIFDFMEAHLGKHPYFGGSSFTTADLMMHFPIMTSGLVGGFDSINYTKVQAWRKKVDERPAFKRALAACVPDGATQFGTPIQWDPPFARSSKPAPMPTKLALDN